MPPLSVVGPDQASPVGRSISVVIPARDEEDRLGRCLAALALDPDATDVLVVDDESSDRTAAVAREHGVGVLAAGPRPPGWAGKVWALHRGVASVERDWVVTLDADTRITAGLLGAAVAAAQAAQADLLTVGGRFDCPSRSERFLHPAMLTSLVYRFGPPGTRRPPRPSRTLANGQCMVLPRRSFLEAGGFEPVSTSLVEDVALGRHIARLGGLVRFVDGSGLLDIAGYGSARAAWDGWGRSLALAEVTPVVAQIADLALLGAVLAAPLPRIVLGRGDVLDVGLVVARAGVLVALSRTYRRRGLTWWLSPLADVAVAAQLVATTVRPVRTWRGRTYAAATRSLVGDAR